MSELQTSEQSDSNKEVPDTALRWLNCLMRTLAMAAIVIAYQEKDSWWCVAFFAFAIFLNLWSDVNGK